MTAILLIHGGWVGPWYWDPFAARLADRGHDVRAVRLRGHDRRPGPIWHRIEHKLISRTRRTGIRVEPTCP